jgi:hypothetical protein
LIPKSEKEMTKERENYRQISLMNMDAKFSIKDLQIEFNNT